MLLFLLLQLLMLLLFFEGGHVQWYSELTPARDHFWRFVGWGLNPVWPQDKHSTCCPTIIPALGPAFLISHLGWPYNEESQPYAGWSLKQLHKTVCATLINKTLSTTSMRLESCLNYVIIHQSQNPSATERTFCTRIWTLQPKEAQESLCRLGLALGWGYLQGPPHI